MIAARQDGEAAARAFGKVILLGEHAVVYGTAALVGGLVRGVTARVWGSGGGGSGLSFGEPYTSAADQHRSTTDRAWAALLAAGSEVATLSAELSGDLPAGMGLGFSAAAGVALARAVEIHRAGTDAEHLVEARAMAWERVFHGNPSGVDVAAAMHGGLLRFSRARGIHALPVDEELLLAVGLTGAPSATRTMVEQVADAHRSRPTHVDSMVERIGAVVEAGIDAAGSADSARLGAAFDHNQELLGELGVSTPAIDRMCAEARAAGALGAKLTGSGGGGAVIALVGVDGPGTDGAALSGLADAIIDRWRGHGWQAFSAAVGVGAHHNRTPELHHD